MQRHSIILGLVLILSMLCITGCNIFSWAGGDSVNSLVAEGNQLMRDGDCAGALDKFAQAIAQDRLFADARYFHAKASLCVAGINILQLGSMMTDSSHTSEDDLPFSDSVWMSLVNDLYYATRAVVIDLNPIFYDSTHGTIDKEAIDVEYAVGLGIYALLMFQDTNLDDVIDSNDVDIHIQYFDPPGVYRITNIDEFEAGTINNTTRVAYFDAISALLNEAIYEIIDPIIDTHDSGDGLDISELKTLLEDILELSEYYSAYYPT